MKITRHKKDELTVQTSNETVDSESCICLCVYHSRGAKKNKNKKQKIQLDRTKCNETGKKKILSFFLITLSSLPLLLVFCI